jgi:hypothetical protein
MMSASLFRAIFQTPLKSPQPPFKKGGLKMNSFDLPTENPEVPLEKGGKKTRVMVTG